MPGPSQYVAFVESDPFRFTVDGLPPLRLVKHYSGLRLAEDATGLLIGPTDTRLPDAGIWIDNLRGTSYNPLAAKQGDFSPAAEVLLRRELGNPHDPSAIAVYDASNSYLGGYFNKRKAKRLVQLVDAGTVLHAVSLRGTAAGRTCDAIAVLAAERHVLDHLLRSR